MPKLLKISLISIPALILVIAAGAFIYIKFMYFPRVTGTVTVSGITDKVEIYRDEYDVPHIIGSNETDVMYGLGYTMAQERPFQLEVYRRAANGQLSEALPGDEMMRMDKFSKFVQFQELGRRVYQNMDEESRGYVDAFIKGVNVGLASLEKGPLPRPITLVAFGGKAGQWKKEDPLALGMMAAWLRTVNYGSEYFYMKLSEKVGAEKAMELLPYYPEPTDSFVHLPEEVPVLAAGDSLRSLLGVGTGCSAWSVSRIKSFSGESMLVYNAHSGDVRAPAEHFLVHLKGGRLDMAGAAIIGVPGFFAGSNGKIAWALTQDNNDATDLYREKTNPENPDQFLYEDEWLPMNIREEKICSKDDKSENGLKCETLRVRSTLHGPVISDLMPDYKSDNEVLSIQWAGFQEDITFNGYVKMAMAQNWEEFRAALDELDISGNHFLFADSEGQIGYQLGGMIPLRKRGKIPPPVPGEGWDDDDIWHRRLTVDEKPHLFDPPEGMMASANNRPYKINDPHYIGSDFFPPQRRDRIYEILTSKDKFTAEEFYDTQKETTNIVARQLLPNMLSDLANSDDEDLQWMKDELEKWDLKMDVDSRGALLFETLFTYTARETFKDEMGEPLMGQFLGANELFRARFFELLKDENNHWFDDTTTDEVETRMDITLRAADMSMEFLADKIGSDRNDWRWGSLHTLTIAHFANDVTKLMNINYGAVPGSEQTVNRFGYSLNKPFGVTVFSDLRMFVDFNDPEHVRAAVHTGQSGWWGHKNYSDQTKMLVDSDLINISRNMDEIKKQSVALLTLEPAK